MTDLVLTAEALPDLPDPENSALVLIERGRLAIGEASTLEAAKSILAQTKVLEAATRAINLTIDTISEAAALRVIAERRVGQLLASLPKNPGARGIGKVPFPQGNDTPKLSELGFTPKQSFRFQRLASIPEQQFSEAVKEAKEEAIARHGGVTTEAILRKAFPDREKRPDEHWLDADRFVDRCKQLSEDSASMLAAVRFGRYPAQEDPIVYDAVLRHVGDLITALNEIYSEISRRHP